MKKAILVLMCGLLFFGVAALADVHFGIMPDEHGMDLRFGDGNELRFGLVASMFWEIGDANANYLAIELPTGGAVDVPMLGIGIGIDGVDLGLFDGQTFPSVFLLDGDNDSYVALTWANDDSPEIEVGGSATSITIPNITAYTWNDDVDLAFGTGSPGSIEWTTADADANCFIFDMPAGSGTDVPGVGIVTTDADFGCFNGETAPFFFIEDDDGDSYIFLGWSADDKAEFVGGGSVSELDVDFDLIRNTTDDFRIEYDASAYMKFAVSDTTGNVAITHVGSTKNATWTTTGAVTFAFGSLDIANTRAYVGFETATFEHRYSYTGLGYDSAVQTPAVNGLQVQNGEALACVGLDGGAAEIGTTEGYVSVGDDEDFLRFVIPIPCLWVDSGQTTSLVISFDVHEKAGEECNIDVRIFEYGNTTEIVSDTLLIDDGDPRQWEPLVTLATGFGAVATLTADDSYLVVEITSNADGDDFWIYGAKLLYQTGIQATQ